MPSVLYKQIFYQILYRYKGLMKSLRGAFAVSSVIAMVMGLSAAVYAQTFNADRADSTEATERAKLTNNRVALAVINAQDKQRSQVAKQQADFEHILFEYFQKQYDNTLMLIEVGDASHQFVQLSKDNQDRLRLIQGAARLNVGLHSQAQTLLLSLLSKTTSKYVQANTWFWLAKAGFENRQYYLSERAFAAIERDDLVEFIAPEQWQELIYVVAFSRMQQRQNWQVMFAKLDEASIYPAYLNTNYASIQFNNGEFAKAQESFVEAKQSLLTHQQIQNSWLTLASRRARKALSLSWLNPFDWFSSDPNAQSQGQLDAQAELTNQQEIDALYDRINLGLAYSLLQQQDDENALDVINMVSTQGGESEQALLTLGWALAQQNRWQNALSIWQYLQKESQGLYGLQASYGMAYAYQQQGDFTQAFYALDDTTKQIRSSIDALQRFSEQVQDERFFDALAPTDVSGESELSQRQTSLPAQPSNGRRQVETVSELATALGLAPDRQDNVKPLAKNAPAMHWPSNLLDIKRMFLSTQADFDASFLLSVRREAKQALNSLDQKAQQLLTLERMLDVRKQRFAKRQQALSLAAAKQALEQAKTQLQSIEVKLANDQPTENLTRQMATPKQANHLLRIENAQVRLSRLLADDTRTRPLNPTLKQRLDRMQGILQWQLDDQFVANHWQHRRFLQEAQQVLIDAMQSYERLAQRQQDTQLFAAQQQTIDVLAISILSQQQHARAIYAQANGQLQENLLMLIEQRIDALNAQQVNTRLAKLRLQDLTPEVQ